MQYGLPRSAGMMSCDVPFWESAFSGTRPICSWQLQVLYQQVCLPSHETTTDKSVASVSHRSHLQCFTLVRLHSCNKSTDRGRGIVRVYQPSLKSIACSVLFAPLCFCNSFFTRIRNRNLWNTICTQFLVLPLSLRLLIYTHVTNDNLNDVKYTGFHDLNVWLIYSISLKK